MHKAKEIFDIQYELAGYNIGINVWTYAGQTINHLHVFTRTDYWIIRRIYP